MNRARSILGAMLLSALAVCAIGAGSASAMTMHECQKAQGTGTKYKDAKCSEASAEGSFETVAIPLNSSVAVEGTLTPTTAGMNVTSGEEAGTHAVLHAVLGGLSVQVTCTGLSTPGAFAENSQDLLFSSMTVNSTGKARFTGCQVAGSEKVASSCKVPATLETVALSQRAEAEVSDKLAFEPSKGLTLITIPFSNKEGKTCPAAIVGEKEIKGVARGAIASPTSLEFTSTSGSELTIGESPAQFTAVVHGRTSGTTGEEGTIALETP